MSELATTMVFIAGLSIGVFGALSGAYLLGVFEPRDRLPDNAMLAQEWFIDECERARKVCSLDDLSWRTTGRRMHVIGVAAWHVLEQTNSISYQDLMKAMGRITSPDTSNVVEFRR